MVFVMLVFIIYGLTGAVRVIQGKDFRYILLGDWVTRYLQGNQAE